MTCQALGAILTASPASVPATAAGEIPSTLSIGIASFTPQDSNIDAILARADRALYRAREDGRDRAELEPAPPQGRNGDD
jgi:diguanylate cyclase (GGDEF)-like protein